LSQNGYGHGFTVFHKTVFQNMVSQERFSNNGFPKKGFPKTLFQKTVFHNGFPQTVSKKMQFSKKWFSFFSFLFFSFGQLRQESCLLRDHWLSTAHVPSAVASGPWGMTKPKPNNSQRPPPMQSRTIGVACAILHVQDLQAYHAPNLHGKTGIHRGALNLHPGL